MITTRSAPPNPFGITKAVDLNDDQIQSLWVSPMAENQRTEYARPISPMPTFVLGGKGSGKTHLMRYHSSEVQQLRYRLGGLSYADGVVRDGYLGIYVRCSGLNSGRFKGKRQPDEVWRELFAYYIELWLVQHLLSVTRSLLPTHQGFEEGLCKDILALFDKVAAGVELTLDSIVRFIANEQRHLDYEVNNCVFTGRLQVEVLASRGRLVFGLPKLFVKHCPFLKDVLFVYSIDEFENLTVEQQRLINTLVREKELPCTLRIGARLYGVRTRQTDSADEENLKDSEFEELRIDQDFRVHKERYADFARQLIEKRLVAALGLASEKNVLRAGDIDWGSFFETFDSSWNSTDVLGLVKGALGEDRRHFVLFREHLSALDIQSDEISSLVRALSADRYPILEKLNILLLYERLYRNKPLATAAEEIRTQCSTFLEKPKAAITYGRKLEHYKGDLLAQLRRENDVKQAYLGLDSFITMSAGLPRALLTILRSIFDWSLFNGEDPLRTHRVSISAQQQGAKAASDWFYENMRKAGEDGRAIQIAVDRLARLFRTNRFADKPIESSLIAFAVAEQEAQSEATRILGLAESRSFIIRIRGGQRDKNSIQITSKFQLSNMLAPRWDLPLARRGTIQLSPTEFEAVFDPTKKAEFEDLLTQHERKMAAPHFGKKARRKKSEQSQQGALF